MVNATDDSLKVWTDLYGFKKYEASSAHCSMVATMDIYRSCVSPPLFPSLSPEVKSLAMQSMYIVIDSKGNEFGILVL